MTTMDGPTWRSFVEEGLRLASVAVTRPDGRPHVTPVCFLVDGDDVVFTTSPQSIKGQAFVRDGRLALTVADEARPYRFVMLECTATYSGDPIALQWAAEAIARRYYPEATPSEFAEEMAAAGFGVVRASILNVVARQDLG